MRRAPELRRKYPWGDDIKLDGKAMANCDGCGSQWDGKQTAPVELVFSPRTDSVSTTWSATSGSGRRIVGTTSYQGAPADGSPWTSGDCGRRVVRGGSWNGHPDNLRSANRDRDATVNRSLDLGFRVARTLTP